MSGVLAIARRWIGTPYVAGAALRGVGCDCVGLLRGVWAEATGRPVPKVPGWRADWMLAPGRPLAAALRAHCRPLSPQAAGPGAFVVFHGAAAGRREHHCGILAPEGRVIHAVERHGVVEVALADMGARITQAATVPEG